MPKVTAEHKERVRRRILDAAEACFHEKGHERTTTRDILERAGISNGTLYHYFESKEDLAASLVDQIVDGNTSFLTATAQSEADELTMVATILRTLLLRSNDNALPPVRVRAAHDAHVRDALSRYDRTMVDTMAPIVDGAKARGVLRESLDTAAVIELVEIFFEGLRSHAAAGTFVTSRKQVALTFLEGLRSRCGPSRRWQATGAPERSCARAERRHVTAVRETDEQSSRDETVIRRRRFRRTKWAVMVLVAVLLALSLAGGVTQAVLSMRALSAHPPPGRMIAVGGHRLHIDCVGRGAPTVVLESSLAGWSIDWSRVQPQLARSHRVCSYDRAGYGWSDPGPTPRTPQRLVSELHELLRNAGERPPFVLVGHSLGGLLVRLYAAMHPRDVEGLVLVEAAHEDLLTRSPNRSLQRGAMALRFIRFLSWLGVQRPFRQPASNLPRSYPSRIRPIVSSIGYRANGYNALYHELAAEIAVANDSREHESLKRQIRGSRGPIVVLTSRTHVARDPVWGELQAELADLSPRARQFFAEKSGHQIELDEPELVVRAVRDVIRESR